MRMSKNIDPSNNAVNYKTIEINSHSMKSASLVDERRFAVDGLVLQNTENFNQLFKFIPWK